LRAGLRLLPELRATTEKIIVALDHFHLRASQAVFTIVSISESCGSNPITHQKILTASTSTILRYKTSRMRCGAR
jgi:RNA-binding protein YlmH